MKYKIGDKVIIDSKFQTSDTPNVYTTFDVTLAGFIVEVDDNYYYIHYWDCFSPYKVEHKLLENHSHSIPSNSPLTSKGDRIVLNCPHYGHVLTVKTVWKDFVTTECGAQIEHGKYFIVGRAKTEI